MLCQLRLPPAHLHVAATCMQEAYEGPGSGCEVAGLPPGSQLVFCLKVLEGGWVGMLQAVAGWCLVATASAAAPHNTHIGTAPPAQALFDDATSLWSEPIMVTTAKRRAGQ